MRLMLAVLVLALVGCGDSQDSGTGKSGAGGAQDPQSTLTGGGAALLGTWRLDGTALLETMIQATRDDLEAEGQDPQQIPADIMLGITSAAAKSHRTLILESDGRFSSLTVLKEPGNEFELHQSGTWKAEKTRIVLSITKLNEDDIDPPDREVFTLKEGVLMGEFSGHTLPFIKQ